MSDNIEWIDEFHDASRILDYVVSELDNLIEAFYITGNITMSRKLVEIKTDVRVARKQGTEAINKMLIERCNDGFNQLGKILGSALDELTGEE